MNNIILVGSIVKIEDFIQGDKSTRVTFILAVKREHAQEDKQNTDFFRVHAFGKKANNLNTYKKVGDWITVKGRFNIDTQKNENGTMNYYHYVVADYIEYLPQSKKKNDEEIEERSEEDVMNQLNDYKINNL